MTHKEKLEDGIAYFALNIKVFNSFDLFQPAAAGWKRHQYIQIVKPRIVELFFNI